ncbi:MAG TPA: amidohydrolase family protein [Burkholderiales bacterium]|nr:amidohydrolase family protein [Burkholderiales bacterium]
MKIDIFNHFLPRAYLDALQNSAPEHPVVRYAARIRPLWDMEERLRMLERWPDLQQVVALGQPTPEMVADAQRSPALARVANDGMAQIRDQWPDRFPAFVASLPMNNVAAALEEMDRAVEKLGARGIQVLTNINGRPLDDAELFPVFERITNRYALPVWMHPYRAPTVPDYAGEKQSEYEIWAVLNWPHESSVAMARLVFSEMFDRLPKLRVITHHCGATIPYLAGRVGPMWDEIGTRGDNARYRAIRERMAQKSLRPIDYFKKFYGDTVVGGSTAALRCGLDFFGPDHVVFASDFPSGPERGLWFLRENLRSVDEVEIGASERDGIYFGNALKLMGMR